jgi:hypothetical protein
MHRSLLVPALLITALAAPAQARSTAEYAYSYEQLWRAAVRLIAVDFRYPISERDPENGYLLFEYREGGRSVPGSVELVRTADRNGAESVRVVISIQAMPSYVERVVLDRLGRKLSDEYGAPPPRARPPAAPPPPERAPEEEEEPEEPPPAAFLEGFAPRLALSALG